MTNRGIPSLITSACCILIFPSAASAEPGGDVNPPVQQQVSLTAAAALLVQANRIDDADRVLALALQQNPDDREAIFLHGLIAVAHKNYDGAVEDFRRILAAEPDRERVRLELARAFFLQADYDNAERNFRFARAGDLPDVTKTVIDQYLAAIMRLRRWSYSASISAADDTNVNGAANVQTINLYGLPFTLSDNARQQSGIGAASDFAAEWSPLLSPVVKARIGATIHRLDYSNTIFDDMTLAGYGGPEWLLGRWEVDTLATGFRRWYGNAPYADGIGGRVAISWLAFPALQAAISFDMQSVAYRLASYQSGPVASGNAALGYTISPSSTIRLTLGAAAQYAQSPAFADTAWWIALDYYRDLPFGFSANLEPAFSRTGYDAPLPAFGATREDSTWAFRLDLLNRRIEYRGFAPRISLIYVMQSSSIGLYRYGRTQAQFGITRQF